MIEIRAARPEDARAIARIHVAVWQATYRGIMPEEVLEEISVDEREANWGTILTAHAATHPVLVCEVPGLGLCGFGNAGPLRDPGVEGYSGEFKTLYLLPAYQRRGLGRAVLGGLAAGLAERGHTAALAWVLAASPACGFFEAMGGKLCAQRAEEIDEEEVLEDLAYGFTDLPALAALARREL
jgi:GNAT superfamily N-acetyltransferase